ncbi:MAG: radical SAM family heme chaperone HemW [Pseudomonadota bacterium]
MEDWRHGGFGLYLHWPYCEAKCPYCDFNSYVSSQIDQTTWRNAYLKELERAAAETPDRIVNAVFFGGGTPSLMDPESVAAIISQIAKHWRLANDLEITLEANPSSVEAGRFSDFRQAGINRISMGVQALNDQDLKRLGRMHSVEHARKAFDIARTAFDRVSFDLIYARQDQTREAWKSELTEALSMAVDHLSLYQLTIEDGTVFGDRYARGKLRGLPNDDLSADMFSMTREICAAHGMPAYEVSNHARQDAQSRHNLIYWRYGDYVGIGPGAHGRLTLGGQKYATEAWRAPQKWLQGVSTGLPEEKRHKLDPSEQATEFLLMGLRLEEGIYLERYATLLGQEMPQEKLDHLLNIGMVELDGHRLRASDEGVLLLNAVIDALQPD